MGAPVPGVPSSGGGGVSAPTWPGAGLPAPTLPVALSARAEGGAGRDTTLYLHCTDGKDRAVTAADVVGLLPWGPSGGAVLALEALAVFLLPEHLDLARFAFDLTPAA